jgi:hypothetical protein
MAFKIFGISFGKKKEIDERTARMSFLVEQIAFAKRLFLKIRVSSNVGLPIEVIFPDTPVGVGVKFEHNHPIVEMLLNFSAEYKLKCEGELEILRKTEQDEFISMIDEERDREDYDRRCW